jgi:hypothetical protein
LERLHRRRRTVALATIAAVAVLAIALVVSRLSGSQGTPPITGAPKDAVATVTEFETALAGRDWAGICNRLYTKRARAAAGGAGCVTTLAQSAGGLREPKVTIVSVTVKGQAATVVVSAAVNGKAPVQDSIQLVREGGRFRIASAGGD